MYLHCAWLTLQEGFWGCRKWLRSPLVRKMLDEYTEEQEVCRFVLLGRDYKAWFLNFFYFFLKHKLSAILIGELMEDWEKWKTTLAVCDQHGKENQEIFGMFRNIASLSFRNQISVNSMLLCPDAKQVTDVSRQNQISGTCLGFSLACCKTACDISSFGEGKVK